MSKVLFQKQKQYLDFQRRGETIPLPDSIQQDLDLIFTNKLDHHLIHKQFIVDNTPIHIFSLNIAQISPMRTMVVFNRGVSSTMRSKPNLLAQKYSEEFLDTIVPELVKKYAPLVTEIANQNRGKRSNQCVGIPLEHPIYKDKLLTSRFQKILKIIPRYAEPGPPKQHQTVFYKRFPDGLYLDFIFDDETVEEYELRLLYTLQLIQHKTRDLQNVIILLQEIQPFPSFLNVYQPNFSDIFHLIFDSVENISKQTFQQAIKTNNQPIIFKKLKYDELYGKSCNLLLTRNWSLPIYGPFYDKKITFYNPKQKTKTSYTLKTESDLQKTLGGTDKILEFFRGTAKSLYQNVKYVILECKLIIYNIHSVFWDDHLILENFIKMIIPQLEQNLKKGFKSIIAGDFNFSLSYEFMHRLKKIAELSKVQVELINTPEILYGLEPNSTYDGFIYKANDSATLLT